MDLTGRTLLGKYVIEGLLGQGGMGAVWRARHALTGRKLAVKTLDEAYVDNPAVMQRFGREARAASACQHPGIVEVLDLDQTEEGIPFLVMEFLEGENLARRIERRGRLTQDEIVDLGTKLLEALEAAHGSGIIHRDLKPENIYVVPAGRRGELVKILDFGISHKRDEAAAKLTMTGSVLGTPHYMSPEQAMGETEADHRADLYAAGVVLYECAVGDVPFDAPNYNKLLRTILDHQPVPPRRRGAQITPELETLILWAMEKEREQRIGSAREMIDWLAKAAAGEAPPYRPPPSQPVRSSSSSSSGTIRAQPELPTYTPAGVLPPRRGGLASTLAEDALSTSDPWAPSEPPPARATPPSAWKSEPPLARSTPADHASPDFASTDFASTDFASTDFASTDYASAELRIDAPSAASPRSKSGELALELDESALRPSIPSSASSSSAGMIPAVGAVTRTGAHPVPPRLATIASGGPRDDLSGRYAPVASPPPEPEAPGWRRHALVGGGVLLALAAAVVLAKWMLGPSAEVPVEPAPIAAPAPREEPPPTAPAWVSVTVEGLPPGAQLRIDGLPASSPIRMRRGGEHVIEIRAPGYEDRRIELTADRNQTVRAGLRPAEGTIEETP